jgi:flagellar biosynthesis protein
MSNMFYSNRRGRDQRSEEKRNEEPRIAAAALRYDPAGDEAPEIVATGRGLTAEEIVRIAKENGIPLHQDAGLVEALAKLDVGSMLPRELYVVVAELLAFIYAVDAEAAASR